MFKLDNPQELVKAGAGLGSLFARQALSLEKSYTINKASAERHADAEKRHRSAADAHEKFAKHAQEQADGMGEDHEMKAHMVESAKLSKAQAEIEKAFADAEHAESLAFGEQADSLKAEIDSMKALANDWGAAMPITKAASSGTTTANVGANGGGVAAMIQETTEALTKKAIESLDSDPAVQEKIREMVLKGVQQALGDKIIPDRVSGVTGFPPGVQPVYRPGQQPVAVRPNVPVEFADLVKVDED